MKGIPKKLNTRQDVFNVCASLDPARGVLYLKNMPASEKARLGIAPADLKKIRSGLAARLRAQRAADKKCRQAERDLAGSLEEISRLKAEIGAVQTAIRAANEAREALPSKRAELATLQREIAEATAAIRGARPVAQIREELEQTEARIKTAEGLVGLIGAIKTRILDMARALKQSYGARQHLPRLKEKMAVLKNELAAAERTGALQAKVKDLAGQAASVERQVKAMGEAVAGDPEKKELKAALAAEMKAAQQKADAAQAALKDATNPSRS